MILHPASLKCGILPIIGKDDQFLLWSLKCINHILGKNVDIGNGDGSQWSDRLGHTVTDVPAALPTTGTERHAAILTELHGPDRNEWSLTFAQRRFTLS